MLLTLLIFGVTVFGLNYIIDIQFEQKSVIRTVCNMRELEQMHNIALSNNVTDY